MNLLARDNHDRAHNLFPGQAYNAQESRRRNERKFRDWDGWLALVAEYHKEELHSTRLTSIYTDER